MTYEPYDPRPQPHHHPQLYTSTSSPFNVTAPVQYVGSLGNISPQHSHGNSQLPSPSSGGVVIPSMPPTNNVARELSSGETLAHRTSSSHSHVSGNLSNDQVEFFHTLYSHNIPAPAIARVMERMVRGEMDPPGENIAGPSGVSRRDSTVTKGPPGYADYNA